MTSHGKIDQSLPSDGRLLGMDLGERRIGLALSDPSQTVAQPLVTLTRRSGKRFPLAELRTHLEVHMPVGIVIGLPYDASGTENERTTAARKTGQLVASRTGLPVEFWDERMTTARVLRTIKELGGKVRGRKKEVDALAATVILQTFLESRRQ
ncbi:MAG: Holliday junction resolvase RuvX [Gemmatimonadales bacterium]